MMCIENAEIAGTVIALSVPALKPLFGNFFSHLSDYYSSGQTRSRSARLQSRSKTATGGGSKARDSKRLLGWSSADRYEMMSSETSVTRDTKGPPSRSSAIKVTNEVNVIGGDESHFR
jgi:hypothetical protein